MMIINRKNKKIHTASWIEAEKYIQTLKKESDEFIIIENPDTQEFIQACINTDTETLSYHVEYADLSTKTLYECNEDLNQKQTIQLFKDFFTKGSTYKTAVCWQPFLDFDPEHEEPKDRLKKKFKSLKAIIVNILIFIIYNFLYDFMDDKFDFDINKIDLFIYIYGFFTAIFFVSRIFGFKLPFTKETS